jgi:putative SOS response-associated peptidase YedK
MGLDSVLGQRCEDRQQPYHRESQNHRRKTFVSNCLLKRRRYLVIADGFYEWSKFEKAKVPFLITLRSQSTFAFAGLWEQWKDATGDWIESTTIITTNPNSLMASIHDRMPLILPSERYGEWLDVSNQDSAQFQKLLIPYPPEEIETEKVSSVINNARNEVDPIIAE